MCLPLSPSIHVARRSGEKPAPLHSNYGMVVFKVGQQELIKLQSAKYGPLEARYPARVQVSVYRGFIYTAFRMARAVKLDPLPSSMFGDPKAVWPIEWFVEEGYHACTTLEAAKNLAKATTSGLRNLTDEEIDEICEEKIGIFFIPPGAAYYQDDNGNIATTEIMYMMPYTEWNMLPEEEKFDIVRTAREEYDACTAK